MKGGPEEASAWPCDLRQSDESVWERKIGARTLSHLSANTSLSVDVLCL